MNLCLKMPSLKTFQSDRFKTWKNSTHTSKFSEKTKVSLTAPMPIWYLICQIRLFLTVAVNFLMGKQHRTSLISSKKQKPI